MFAILLAYLGFWFGNPVSLGPHFPFRLPCLPFPTCEQHADILAFSIPTASLALLGLVVLIDAVQLLLPAPGWRARARALRQDRIAPHAWRLPLARG